jgi:FKBP-type peptidyl-prolyl cis-trans isomerase SlyD
MEITKDTFVVIEYTLRLADGSTIKGSAEEGPASLNFIAGYEQILPALEHRLLGFEAGAEVEFVVPPEEAFGEHLPHLVQTRSFAEFPQGRTLIVGKWIIATNEPTQAQFSYHVNDKNDEAVVLDFNHPLAGKSLHYRVKVMHVRAALPEELAYLRPCEFEKEPADTPEAASP